MLKDITFYGFVTLFFLNSYLNANVITSNNMNWDNVITFEEIILEQNEPLTNQYSSFGVTFESGNDFPQYFYLSSGTNWGGIIDGHIYDDHGGGGQTTIQIHYSQPVTSSGFNFRSSTGNIHISTYLSGNIVESNVFDTFLSWEPLPEYFVGFNNSLFDTISILIPNGVGMNLDNLSFNPIPEPLTLSILGLGGLVMLRRRKI